MATVAEKPITAEEYGDLPDNGQPTELVRGRIVPLNMPVPRHGEICGQTYYLVRRYLDDNPRGRAVCNDSGVVTERNPDTVRGADVAFYSYARVPPGLLPNTYLSVSPDLVFEVRSPGDRWSEIHIKVGEYLRAGVTTVCVLDEQTQTALVAHAEKGTQRLGPDEELTFPDILPGFRMPVRRFFE